MSEKQKPESGTPESIIQFNDVSFFYGPDQEDQDETEIRAVENPAAIAPIFQRLTLEMPAGVVSLVGENGIGKTTFLLLCGGRLFPASGTVRLFGRPTGEFHDALENEALEEERNRLVSFVYQNMEFETTEPIGTLMEQIYERGYHREKSPDFLKRLVSELELGDALTKRLQVLSKGQMQRAIIAFSLLYGSKLIIMDEPVFALEERQKDRAFTLLMDFASQSGTSIYYSAHNLELTQRFSDQMVLFSRGGKIEIGPTEKMFTRDGLEAAYRVPLDTLYRRDSLYRDMLNTLQKKR